MKNIDVDCKNSIGDFSGKSSNLNFLKFIAAIAVIFSHAYSIVNGQGGDLLFKLSKHQFSFGGLSVAIFFFASGFYVTKSLCNKKNGKIFWRARIGKIYPAFIVVIFTTVFFVGPVVSKYSLKKYFFSKETYLYLLYVFMIPKYELPGVFIDNPISIVNGSLWTLILEMICYCGLFLAYKIGILEKDKLKKINVILWIFVIFLFGIQPQFLYQFHDYFRPLCIFIVGMEFYIFREKIFIDRKRMLWSIGIGSVLLYLQYVDLFMVIIFPYLLSTIVFNNKQVKAQISSGGKYSYGMYLVN